VGRDRTQIVRLASGRAIEGNVERYLKEIQEKKVPTSLGEQILKDLITPIRNLKSRLVIVPDGKLNNLPFETLPVAPNQLLVHSHQVLYCPSSTVLAAIRSRVAAKKQLAFLGVGDIPYGGDTTETSTRGIEELQWKKLQPLPASREEVVTAAHLLGKQSVLLMGPKATEATFKRQALERYQVLHLALHGFSDLKNPDRASLVFNLDPDPNQDGLLQAREIAGLNLRSDLVTLSACNTAVGPVQAQEGIDNLVKAFLIAGARNVIASLWPAEDRFTLALMKQFYTHLAKGKDKAEALQLAKLSLLTEFGNNLPLIYWAGFKLVGHGGTLTPGSQ
jgi:CHAT domain-containing protein